MDWKKKTLLIYILGGLICGILAGIMTVRNAEQNKKELDITLKDGAKIGLTTLESQKKVVIK